MFEHIKIMLCETSHPGNIGGAARAMKNMGLTQLTLVSPLHFPDPRALERASGADDVLSNAVVTTSLEEAIGDCHWVFGTSARQRAFPWPQITPKDAAEKISHFAYSGQKVAVIFGTEQSGLTNEQLQTCDYHICIPTHEGYASLNLAAAVQVIAYEIYQQFIQEKMQDECPFEKATHQEIIGLIEHFEKTAVHLGFLNHSNPKKLLPRVKRLLTKAQLEKEEVNILRGFLKLIQQKTNLD